MIGKKVKLEKAWGLASVEKPLLELLIKKRNSKSLLFGEIKKWLEFASLTFKSRLFRVEQKGTGGYLYNKYKTNEISKHEGE